MNRHPLLKLLLAASLLASTTAFAQTLARADADFMKEADHANRTEIEASGLALKSASSEKVKAFAKQMSSDHSKVGDELKTLAEKKGVALPGEPSLAQQAKIKLLAAMKGERFDRQYAEIVGVTAHEDTIKLFRKAAAEASDPDVKAFARKTLPQLEHHLKSASTLKQAVASTDK
ncbi:MAG TPA: DUF4142 domain-containing protein [Methylibium sp.]|uniref:DUF4142 domain-containing protein n=1 Tax=Methylibium sp. TaxID=2067992 RepID=UPI002DBF701E|nr:DUF4142 domain-containing protein [Methylibium sp.]HEU4458962.1 DUF4142 domain-containing protein [Methylibium sp.]